MTLSALGRQQREDLIVPGWIEPPDPTVSAEYWLTRRNVDAVDGYGGFSEDVRVKYRWAPGSNAWITGYTRLFDGKNRMSCLHSNNRMSCLHSNNGWRIDADQSTPRHDLAAQVKELGADSLLPDRKRT